MDGIIVDMFFIMGVFKLMDHDAFYLDLSIKLVTLH